MAGIIGQEVRRRSMRKQRRMLERLNSSYFSQDDTYTHTEIQNISSSHSGTYISPFDPCFIPQVHNKYIRNIVKVEKLAFSLKELKDLKSTSMQQRDPFLRHFIEAFLIGWFICNLYCKRF